MGQRLALRLRRVLEQRAAGADGEGHVLAAEAGQRRGAELLQQPLLPGLDVEVPCRDLGNEKAFPLFRAENFRGPDPAQFIVQRLGRDFGDAQLAGSEREPRQSYRGFAF